MFENNFVINWEVARKNIQAHEKKMAKLDFDRRISAALTRHFIMYSSGVILVISLK